MTKAQNTPEGWRCELKQSNHRRAYWMDYKDPSIVLLTLVTTDRLPLLGELRGETIIHTELGQKVAEEIERIPTYKGAEAIEVYRYVVMPDHVHMLVMIPPKYSIASVMGYLKGKSSLMIFDRFSQLKYKYGNRRFWSVGYYVSTVGLNEATIRKYIREQDNADIMLDKMTTKEYADPFRPKQATLL